MWDSRSLKLGFLVLLALVLILALTMTGIALAGSGKTIHGPRMPGLRESTSTNWSGYALQTSQTRPQNNAVSDVKGTWTVPTVTSSSVNSYSAVWVGIDGYADNTVEQIGTEEDYIGGAAQYSVWYEMYPKNSVTVAKSVYPGDVISAEVRYIGNNGFTLTISDITRGWSFSTTQKAGNARRQSAEWVVEAPWMGGVLPLANFGKVNFSGAQATVNGVTKPISNWWNDPINMTTSGGTVIAQTSPLSPDGASFSVTRVGPAATVKK